MNVVHVGPLELSTGPLLVAFVVASSFVTLRALQPFERKILAVAVVLCVLAAFPFAGLARTLTGGVALVGAVACAVISLRNVFRQLNTWR